MKLVKGKGSFFRMTMVMLLCMIILSNMGAMSKVEAAATPPEIIRVGLNYSSTALSQFAIGADKGIAIGVQVGNVFTPVLTDTSTAKSTIRKDLYFLKDIKGYTEYVPGATAPAGEKVGPYHVKLGGSFADLTATGTQIAEWAKKGITAYPAFADGWQVWTGFYVDQASAEEDMKVNLKAKAGSIPLTMIPPDGTRIVVHAANGGVSLLFGSSVAKLQIRPNSSNFPYSFKLGNGDTYRGDLEVLRKSDANLTLINILPFEQYLYSNVTSEMESYSPTEALKAQAVASRTYSLNNIGKHGSDGFDVCSTTHCQAYHGIIKNGMKWEAASTAKAVDETKGQLVKYNGVPAMVFYHGSSGGMTESVKNVWSQDIPYLVAVESPYEDQTSFNFNWSKTITAAELKTVLKGKGVDIGDITGMKIAQTTLSGRAMEVVVTGTTGAKSFMKEATRSIISDLSSRLYTITADASSAGSLYALKSSQTVSITLSNLVAVTSKGVVLNVPVSGLRVLGANNTGRTITLSAPKSYKFTGKGWGHGVGMSQEGAKGMAKAGFKYDAILKHFFKGTSVE